MSSHQVYYQDCKKQTDKLTWCTHLMWFFYRFSNNLVAKSKGHFTWGGHWLKNIWYVILYINTICWVKEPGEGIHQVHELTYGVRGSSIYSQPGHLLGFNQLFNSSLIGTKYPICMDIISNACYVKLFCKTPAMCQLYSCRLCKKLCCKET